MGPDNKDGILLLEIRPNDTVSEFFKVVKMTINVFIIFPENNFFLNTFWSQIIKSSELLSIKRCC